MATVQGVLDYEGKTIQKVIEVYVRLSPVISSKNASLSQFTLQSSFDIHRFHGTS